MCRYLHAVNTLHPFLPLWHNVTRDPKSFCFAYLIVVCLFVYNARNICALSPLHTPQLFHIGTPNFWPHKVWNIHAFWHLQTYKCLLMPKQKSYYGSWSHNTNKKSWLLCAKWPQSWPADYLRMICPLWLPDCFSGYSASQLWLAVMNWAKWLNFLVSLIKMLCFQNQLNSFHLILKWSFVSDGTKDLLYLGFSFLMFLSLSVVLGVDFYALHSLEKSSEIFLNDWETYFSTFESLETLC